MTWVLVGVAVWLVLAALGALLVGRAIHLADAASPDQPNVVVDDDAADVPARHPTPPRVHAPAGRPARLRVHPRRHRSRS
jgi:hypothetical protein